MKKTLAIVLALVMVLGLVACKTAQETTATQPGTATQSGNQPAGDQPAGDQPAGDQPAGDQPEAAFNPFEGLPPYDITVWVGEAAVDLTKEQIEKFNNTNELGIKFNATVQGVSEATSADMMLVDISVGADIFCFAQDQFARLVQGKALAPLDDEAMKIVKEANDPGVVTAATSGDKMYAYPLTSDNGYFMYYDKTVIPEEDVDSLEKLIADCEAAGKYFAFETNTSAWYIASWFFATGCKSEWTTGDNGEFISVADDFNSDKGLIAVKGMKKLVDSQYHISSSSGDEFASDAAIVVTGTWSYESIRHLLADHMGVTDLPSFTVDGKEYHLGSFNGCKLMGVKPQADGLKLLALQLLAEYLTGEDCQMERFDKLSWGPSNLKAQSSEAVQNNPGLAALLKQNQYSRPQGQIHGAWWDIAKVIGDDVKAATDEAGLKQALQNYYDKIAALFTMTEEEKTAWGVVGNFLDSNWVNDYPMKEIAPGIFQSDPIEMKAGNEFKVRQGGAWNVNYGFDEDGNTKMDGQTNAKVPADDIYTITIDTNIPLLTFVNQEGILPEAAPVDENAVETWGVVGGFEASGWADGNDIPMTEKEAGVWVSAPVDMKAGDEYKVRANGKWDKNYGFDEEVNTKLDGQTNGKVEADGTYIVTLDLTNADAPVLSIAEKEPDVWGVVGSFAASNWGESADVAMTEVEPGLWKSEPFELKAGELFKVRANNAWDLNYGITEGATVAGGDNVAVEADGNYVVTLDLTNPEAPVLTFALAE